MVLLFVGLAIERVGGGLLTLLALLRFVVWYRGQLEVWLCSLYNVGLRC